MSANMMLNPVLKTPNLLLFCIVINAGKYSHLKLIGILSCSRFFVFLHMVTDIR